MRRGPGRHPRVPVRRAGDPRRRGRAAPAPSGRASPTPAHPDAVELVPAVRPAVRRGAAPRVRAAPDPAGRAGDQRRRDVADRPGHPVRRRPRARPASRGSPRRPRSSGCRSSRSRRRSANQRVGPLRPRRRRHRDPAVLARTDFDARPEFTEPEILRTSLASVILQMIAVGRRRDARRRRRFPFVEPPDVRAIRDGVAAAHRARRARGERRRDRTPAAADRDRSRDRAAADGPAAGPDDRRGRPARRSRARS